MLNSVLNSGIYNRNRHVVSVQVNDVVVHVAQLKEMRQIGLETAVEVVRARDRSVKDYLAMPGVDWNLLHSVPVSCHTYGVAMSWSCRRL